MADTKYSIERIDAMEGHEFEHFTATLLRELGYENVEVTRGSGDQGVDVLAEKESVRYAIQCKCYSSDLGNTPVQEVNTGKVIYHCHIGVVVTNRYFTQGAKEAAKATGVLLWDRDKLRDLMVKANLISRTSFGTSLLMALNGSEWEKQKAKEQEERDRYKQRAEEQKKINEIYKQIIISYLYANPEFVATVDNTMARVLRPAYPDELWSSQKVKSLLNALISEEKLVLIKAKNKNFKDVFKLSEVEHHRQKIQEVILSHLSMNSELAVTPHDIMIKVLMPTYPDELWDDMKAASLLNDLCDKESRLCRVKDKTGNDTFMITKAERRRQEEKRAKKKAALESEQATLQTEFANLKGLFAGRRRREIEQRLAEIEANLTELNIK